MRRRRSGGEVEDGFSEFGSFGGFAQVEWRGRDESKKRDVVVEVDARRGEKKRDLEVWLWRWDTDQALRAGAV